jgi:SNF2 family DNA or RNA helicase
LPLACRVQEWKSSTKLEALVEELDRLRAEDVTTKTLVFSQFVSFLDIVAFRLKRAGFKVRSLPFSLAFASHRHELTSAYIPLRTGLPT